MHQTAIQDLIVALPDHCTALSFCAGFQNSTNDSQIGIHLQPLHHGDRSFREVSAMHLKILREIDHRIRKRGGVCSSEGNADRESPSNFPQPSALGDHHRDAKFCCVEQDSPEGFGN